MPKTRSWTDEELAKAVKNSRSYRAVLLQLKLVPAGGNYDQIKRRVNELHISTNHFSGKGWNVGMKFHPRPVIPVEKLLTRSSYVQSCKLKTKLFAKNLKKPKCELCGWSKKTPDGRIPVELDHINGVSTDNRLENLRILCPNCHSLQPTHRGRNKRVKLARVL